LQDGLNVKITTAKSIALLLCSLAVLVGGCRRPAFQDVYVQNMAAEIRELEDIIYEYDHEYRKLELELESAKRENDMLKKLGINSKSNSSLGSGGSTASPSDKNWQDREPAADTPAATPPVTPKAPLNKSEPEKNLTEGPVASPPKQLNEEPPSTPLKNLDAEGSTPLKLEPSPAAPANENALPKPPASILPPPAGGSAGRGGNQISDPGLMEPPAIDLGTPTESLPTDLNKKPASESGKVNGGSSSPVQLLPPPTLGALDEELGRIPASKNARRKAARSTDPQSLEASSAVSQASYAQDANSSPHAPREDASVPLDQRMTEISFVRPFSIALDLDGQPGDDAVRLVLQPRNAAGEFLAQPAELTVSILDPEVQDESGRIGIWRFTPQQIEQAIKKQGNAKGIHVDISLEGKVPAGKKVLVFVRYQTADGRRVESNYEYTLSAPGDLDSKWLPRAGNSSRNMRNGSG
jgi:hypothetical protein